MDIKKVKEIFWLFKFVYNKKMDLKCQKIPLASFLLIFILGKARIVPV